MRRVQRTTIRKLEKSDSELCRGVICIGVPYPPATDAVVVAKRLWNDASCACGGTGSLGIGNANTRTEVPAKHGALSGTQWYELQAYRAVNQALGRCIRHQHDYGTLVAGRTLGRDRRSGARTATVSRTVVATLH